MRNSKHENPILETNYNTSILRFQMPPKSPTSSFVKLSYYQIRAFQHQSSKSFNKKTHQTYILQIFMFKDQKENPLKHNLVFYSVNNLRLVIVHAWTNTKVFKMLAILELIICNNINSININCNNINSTNKFRVI
jgi:hypothetical protein